jgi:4-oxalocrotonate tautomerase
VIVKLTPDRTEEQKTRLAEEIAKDAVSVLNCGEEAVSVSFEEIDPQS